VLRISDPIGETSGAGAPELAGALRRCSPSPSRSRPVDIYLVSTVLVALAEMGDRTQLLAVMLASRFRRPAPILLGIFAATIANHTLAALAGYCLSSLLSAVWFKYAVSASFVAMAVWALIPDKEDEDDAAAQRGHLGVFLTTVVSFFLVEMGDKTQIATVALAARYHSVLLIAAGTTTGMMLANIPAVLLGHGITRVLPMRLLHVAAALVYLGLGLWGIAATAGWVR
jgi:putative Ca2+/H+ antiporter (TMEM165/GDT1 family)